MDYFELAGGTIIGREHYQSKFNNQDAFSITSKQDLIVAFVCDGCGDKTTSGFSEVGAHIGSQLLTLATIKAARRYLKRPHLLEKNSFSFWEQIRQEVLMSIRFLCQQMGEDMTDMVIKYFLFTAVGVLITPEVAQFVSIGDGVMIINNQELQIGPFPDNMPPYLGYALVPSTIDPELLKFQLQISLPTADLESFLIGCDGVVDLINAENLEVPTNKKVVGPISQFWTEDLFFNNPLSLTRRLTVINRDRSTLDLAQGKINQQSGLLRDDTTLVVGRRKETPEDA